MPYRTPAMRDDWPTYAVAYSPDGTRQKVHLTRRKYSRDRKRAVCGLLLQDRDQPQHDEPNEEEVCQTCVRLSV